jgi:triacylglycerol lipase
MNLVFASGFLFPQRLFKNIAYFRGVEKHLAGQHATLFPPVPVLASSRERARLLGDQIHQAFPAGPIHIIAHSMGGLDSRHLIAANHRGLAESGRIVSLTTLATPHQGSPVADLLVGRDRGFFSFIANPIKQLLGRLPLDLGALEDLTSENARAIPDITHIGHIRYRSYAAAGRRGEFATARLLLPLHEIVSKRKNGQPNDGVVALDSARFGEFQEPPWPCDHLEMVGHDLDNLDLAPSRFDHLREIDQIIKALPAV